MEQERNSEGVGVGGSVGAARKQTKETTEFLSWQELQFCTTKEVYSRMVVRAVKLVHFMFCIYSHNLKSNIKKT